MKKSHSKFSKIEPENVTSMTIICYVKTSRYEDNPLVTVGKAGMSD